MSKKDKWQKFEKEPKTWSENPETKERLEKFRKNFEDTSIFENLETIFKWDKQWEKIKETIAYTYETLRENNNSREQASEYFKKYEITGNFSEELAVIVAVETKLWNNLDKEQKIELISLIIWRDIKISNTELENTEKFRKNTELENILEHIIIDEDDVETGETGEGLLKQIKEHPEYPILEWLLEAWKIDIEYIQKKIKIWEVTGLKIESLFTWIENKIKELKEKNSNDFTNAFPNFIEWKEESEMIKKLSENYINFWNWNEKLWLIVTIEKTLNELNKKTFRKNDLYYEYVEKIRRKPLKSETIEDVIKNKIWKLAYIMWLIDWKNPFYNEEKNSIKLKEKENLEKKEEINKFDKAERIKELVEKNNWKEEAKWDTKIQKELETARKIQELEKLDRANNPDYKKEILNDSA